MNNLLGPNLDDLEKLILEQTMSSRRLDCDECVGNYGCSKDTVLVQSRNGDFYGFSVKALEPIRPIFTDKNILEAIQLYRGEEYDAIVRLLHLKDELLVHGYSIIDYVICKFLEINKLPVPQGILFGYRSKTIDEQMKLTRSDTIRAPLEIVDIGNQVVPSDWIGKQYESAEKLHRDIDTLDWRKGKPPVTYCVTYGMKIVEKKIVQLIKNLGENKKLQTIYVQIETNHHAKLLKNKSQITKTHFIEYLSEIHRLVIVYNPEDHFTNDIELTKYSVGLLSSTLQKCVRHGRCSLDLLEETIHKMGTSKPYNLPEQQYLKVSGCRQLFWRSFITIIEDFRMYKPVDDELSLFDLLIFSLVTNKEPDYSIRNSLLDKIKYLMRKIASCDAPNDYSSWRKQIVSTPVFDLDQSIGLNTIFLADHFMPKMSGDGVMIKKYFSLLKVEEEKVLKENEGIVDCNKCNLGMTPKYTGVDIHCYPGMILQFQGSYRGSYTTQEISSMIWELNSKYNNRKPDEFIDDMFTSRSIKTIYLLQKNYWDEYDSPLSKINDLISTTKTKTLSTKMLNDYDKRVLFLKLVGNKVKIPAKKSGEKVLEVVFSYEDYITSGEPMKIKYVNSEEYLKESEYAKNIDRVWNYFETNRISIQIPECLPGYKWKLVKNVEFGMIDRSPVLYHRSEAYELPWFDASSFVTKISTGFYTKPTIKDYYIILNLLHINKKGNLFDCNYACRNYNENRMINIKPFYKKCSQIVKEWFSNIMVKIITCTENTVEISQVARSGEKLDNSVDYVNEGRYWALMNLLKYCYPKAISISGDLKYRLHPEEAHYVKLMEDLEYCVFGERNKKYDETIKKIQMKTELWSHQKNTVDFILKNIQLGKRGFGDASNVGAGKTLSALASIVEIYKYNKQRTAHALVLLPTEKLYKTWRDEINKHFGSSISILEQQANGTLLGKEGEGLHLIITTMGRNREHSLMKDWLFVVIDECLTVQNKEALQTMAAWIQSIHSKYGVLLLSATFFRTRFDKLLYMLKMLQCNLPETKEYLDTILTDSIKVHLPLTKREWTETVLRESLEEDIRKDYDTIYNSDLPNEVKFIRLQKIIRDRVDSIQLFKKCLSSLKDKKVLIYAESKEEAEEIAKKIPNVGLYPDISKKHVVVSYANGTYGLNDLVGCNTILTRPPEPDKLPQMKGRLDRPGQKESHLDIYYMVLERTIEEAKYLRIDLCNKFYSNHIMPLGDFYTLALQSQ